MAFSGDKRAKGKRDEKYCISLKIALGGLSLLEIDREVDF